MPLKHPTETFFIFLLAVLVAGTGIVITTLPPLPDGMVPWGLCFSVSLIYPLLLLPVFRSRRADYPLRLLHLAPAAMLLVWLSIEGAAHYWPGVYGLWKWYTWAWTLPAVTFIFVLLAAFCVSVVRRWVQRTILLLLVFLPFTVGAVMSQRGAHWEKELATTLWGGEWWKETGSGSLRIAFNRTESGAKSVANLSHSEDSGEETWRERLRLVEERKNERMDRREREEQELEDERVETGTGEEIREVATLPAKLPSSGFGMEFLGVGMLAAYCGTVHRRARKRVL